MRAVGLEQVAPLIQDIMLSEQRINTERELPYWYPLSLATYSSEEVMEALHSLVTFRTSMWEKTRSFEEAFGSKFGGEAVMVNSGSSADLMIAFGLHKLSGGPLETGDEVLVPAVTWPTQLWSLLMAGYSARLVDVDPETLNVDLRDLEAKIGPRTRAISLVHLMGNPVNMDAVREICDRHHLILFEDCCESLGAQWNGQFIGTFGQASAFSFFFSHHITTLEGGMILTRDSEFAERLRLLRAHGWSRNLRNPPEVSGGLDPRYTFLSWGFNVRPTELQAGFGLVQLGRFDAFQIERNANASIAIERLKPHREQIRLMSVLPGGSCSWFALPLTVDGDAPFTRDQLTAHLELSGVETRPIVTGNLARHPAIQGFGAQLRVDDLPGADYVHENGFYIGLHPVRSNQTLGRVFDLIDDFIASSS